MRRRHLRGGLPHRPGPARPSTCACCDGANGELHRRVLRQPGSVGRRRPWRRDVGAHGARHVDRAARGRTSTIGRVLGPAQRRPSRPTSPGAWRLGLESAGRSRAAPRRRGRRRQHRARRGARASTAPERAGRGRLRPRRRAAPTTLAVDVWPRSALLPHHGSADRRAGRPTPSDEFERAVAAGAGGRRRRGRRRFQRPVGVRGARPARPVAARPPARTGRGGARGEPAHRGRGQRGLPRRDAVGGARRRRAPDVVRRRRGGRRAGRHHRRRWPSRRAGCPSRSRPGSRTGRTGWQGGAVSGGRRARSSTGRASSSGYRLLRDHRVSPAVRRSGTGCPTATSCSTRSTVTTPTVWSSGSSTRATGGAPRSSRSTCGHSDPGSRGPTGSWSGSPRSTVDPGEPRDGRGGARTPPPIRYWDVDTHGWRSDPGRYEVLVGASSRDIRAIGPVTWGCATGGDRRRGAPVTASVDVDMGPAAGRAAATPDHPGAPECATGSPSPPSASAPSWASSTPPSSPSPCRPCSSTFDASVGAVTWVGLSYLLVLVATVTAVGRFADMWGRKLLYVYGFVIFTLASVLCGLAPDLARVVRLPGPAGGRRGDAAGEQPGHHRARGAGDGRSGARSACRAPPRRWGSAVGPTIGGLLLAAGGWRLIFFVNVPFGVFGAVAAILLVPRSRNLMARVRFDWTGLGDLLPGGRGSAVGHLLRGGTSGWSSAADRGPVRRGGGAVRALHLARAPRQGPDARPGTVPKRAVLDGDRHRGSAPTSSCSACCCWCPSTSSAGSGLGTARSGLELMAMPLAFGIVAPLAGRVGRPGRARGR